MMERSTVSLVLAAVVLVLLGAAVEAHDDQRYDLQEKVPLFVDNLIPDNNPSESYRFFKLKFCHPPDPMKYKSQTLGEVLQGSRKIYSKYDIRFGVDLPHEVLCTQQLEEADIAEFRHAIINHFHFTMYYDEIPLKGYVGVVENDDVYLYTNLQFKMSFNRDRVIEARVTPDPSTKVKLPADAKQMEVAFGYSAKWHETEVTFEDRSANNPQELFVEEVEIQWFSIVNSFVLVVLLTGFLSFIVLKILKKDYQRYTALEEEDEQDETGWKLLHADVFRFPPHKELFACILGSGVQLLLIAVSMLTLSVVGVFYPYGRGTMYAAVIIIYALTAVIAGYTSGAMYRKLGGTVWVNTVLIQVTIFAVPVFLVWAFLNTVAIVYESTAALPFGTIMALFALYFLVAFPLTLAGSIMGKNYGGSFDAPTRTKQAQREIPSPPWYRTTLVHILVAGFLPFSAIYVELYYVFISLWGHQLFTPYGILYLVFVILLLVTACITVSLTYLQLSMEDHKWWWKSVFSGGATGLYIYVYCFHFLMTESKMSGFLQLSFYFGYMGLSCYAMFLMLGSVGFFSSLAFVKQIYRSIRCD